MHVAGGRARRDAAFRVCTAVGTGDYAVPLDLMQRLDPQRLLRVAHSAPESLKRRAFTKIDGAVTEVYTSTARGRPLWEWLMKQPNLADFGAPYAAAYRDFSACVSVKVRRIMQDLMGFSAQEVAAYNFVGDTESFLQRKGVGPPQAPHVDVNFGGVQFTVACTPFCKPMYLYKGEHVSLEDALRMAELTDDERRAYDERSMDANQRDIDEMMAPLSLPRAELVSRMKPAFFRSLNLGEIVAAAGPKIHGGPESSLSDEQERIVFFGTAHMPGFPVYDGLHQTLPWIYMQDHLRSARGFVRSVTEWTDTSGTFLGHSPHKHYPTDIGRRECLRIANTRDESAKIAIARKHFI